MEEQTSQWAIVELFGHKTMAGRITKDTSLFPLLRIDVPATIKYPEFTAEYGPGAIYGITYVSEEIARKVAQSISVNPITVYSPELITRETFEKMEEEYRTRLRDLRALPEGTKSNLLPFDLDDDEDEPDDEKAIF